VEVGFSTSRQGVIEVIPVLTAQEMRERDARAIREYGIPSCVLMENAGVEATREILEAYPALRTGRAVVLCGKGNNGGDGFVVARRLREHGAHVETFLVADPAEIVGDARVNLEILTRLGEPVRTIGPGDLADLRARLAAADVVVDGLLGTGVSGPVTGLLAESIECVNACGRPVVALDLPSGLGADGVEALGVAVQATLTVAFGFPKRSLVLHPAASHAGRVRVVDIGIPRRLAAPQDAGMGLLEASDVSAAFPARPSHAHKGTFGHVLVIAGSVGKTGAAALASQAALRIGAGLVTLAIPASLNAILEAKLTEVMTEPVPETEAQSIGLAARGRLLALAGGKSAVVLGPGLGTHPETAALVRELVPALQVPLVLDADGLNALAGAADLLKGLAAPVVLTPHPGEMGRLTERPRDEVVRDRIRLVRDAARQWGVTLVLKTARTLIGSGEGPVAIVPTGNPGMATAGTGDVLAGAIAGLMGRGASARLAAAAGAYVHGLAGDLTAERLGEEAMLAGDLLEDLPEAIRRVKANGGADPARPVGGDR
jgi:NAD(P)H-hydrate epimerase